MNDLDRTNHLQDWVNLILAVCLFVSPWVLNYAGDPMAARTAWVSAVLVGVLAVAAIFAFTEWEEWANLTLGVWIAASPWAIGFAGNGIAVRGDIVLGVLIAVVAGWELWDEHYADTRTV